MSISILVKVKEIRLDVSEIIRDVEKAVDIAKGMKTAKTVLY